MNSANREGSVGHNLKMMRTSRSLSLEAAARLTGVSKPMLSQIERGVSSPTIAVLWKIAEGFKVPLSSLTADSDISCHLADIAHLPVMVEEQGKMRAWTLSAFNPVSGMEVFYIELDPGCVHASSGHNAGTVEYIFPARGSVNMKVEENCFDLQAGQSLRFDGALLHVYSNTGNNVCSFYNLIEYH